MSFNMDFYLFPSISRGDTKSNVGCLLISLLLWEHVLAEFGNRADETLSVDLRWSLFIAFFFEMV